MPKGPRGDKRPGEVIGAAIIVARIAALLCLPLLAGCTKPVTYYAAHEAERKARVQASCPCRRPPSPIRSMTDGLGTIKTAPAQLVHQPRNDGQTSVVASAIGTSQARRSRRLAGLSGAATY